MTALSAVMLGGSYLLGSIPTGYWIGQAWKGIDVRQHGSGNLGATNVFRVLGKGPGALTLVLDILKGVAPVLLSARFFPSLDHLPLAAGICSIAGHATSPFVGFRGGKGVATSAGVFLALLPGPTVVAIAAFLMTLILSRFVSLSSIVGSVALATATWMLSPFRTYSWVTVGLVLFVIWTHRGNIRRLLQGTEHKIGQKAGA